MHFFGSVVTGSGCMFKQGNFRDHRAEHFARKKNAITGPHSGLLTCVR